MAKPKAEQIDIPDWRFTCILCGQCCRRWHVELMPGEAERLQELDWSADDGIPERRTERVAGRLCLAHGDDDACVYLNPEANTCKIQGRFGYEKKPLGCRIYPYSIAPTFPGRFSVIGRFDCPGIRANQGEPIRASLREIRRFIDALQLDGQGFAGKHLDGLEQPTVRKIATGLIGQVLERPGLSPFDRMVLAAKAADRLESLGSKFLNYDHSKDIFPSMFTGVADERIRMKVPPPGLFGQWRFLGLFSAFMRRDEERMGKGAAMRVRRALTLARFFFSRANLRDLGREHPDGRLSRRVLFGAEIEEPEAAPWALLFDLVRVRLEALQFFGRLHVDYPFYLGLKLLFLLFPLAVAAAKWRALVRDPARCRITAEDMDYAVGAVDHCFGLSGLLRLPTFPALTRQLAEPYAFAGIIGELLAGSR